MLTVDLRHQTTATTAPTVVLVTITNFSIGRIANYEIAVHVSKRVVTIGELREYPRWCEPVSGLVARCFVQVRTELPLATPLWPLTALSVTTSIVPGCVGASRRLSSLCVSGTADGRYSLTHYGDGCPRVRRRFHTSHPIVEPAWLAIRAFSHALWRTETPPGSLPSPEVPVRVHEGRGYVRACDLPPFAVAPFHRYAHGWALVVPGEAQPWYPAWTWDAFLGPDE
jgi:hypothetical protein